jgi:hypothetical protein
MPKERAVQAAVPPGAGLEKGTVPPCLSELQTFALPARGLVLQVASFACREDGAIGRESVAAFVQVASPLSWTTCCRTQHGLQARLRIRQGVSNAQSKETNR